MGILIKKVRIHGFRGLENTEFDLEPMTVIVGSNNSGKTTFLKALQIAFGNYSSISIDDFFYSDTNICDNIIIDVLVIPVNSDLEQIDEFEDSWAAVFTTDRITITAEGKQILCFRTKIEEDLAKKTYRKKQFVIDEWVEFENEEGFWYEKSYNTDQNFYFDEIPVYYIDANRDILEDIKLKTSYLGKLLSAIEYNIEDKIAIEDLIRDLNKMTIDRSEILTNIETTLQELDTAMDNPNSSVSLTPFTKKIKDLNKGVNINYSDFAMDYHGMGTRSWSSLLVLKSFLKFYQDKFEVNEQVYFPILAIEEPEAHLHPNAQKKLYSQIKGIPGQKIISTHSNYIAGCANLKEIRSLLRRNVAVEVGKFDESGFDPEEIRKIKRQVINTRGELFFSKIVVLFEGETEEQALPILTEKYFSKTAMELGVDFIGVAGSGNYTPFINFCECLNIEYLIFSDNETDANTTVNKQISNSKKKDISKVVFLNTGCDFEKELIDHGYLDEVKLAYAEIELEKCTNEFHRAAKIIQLNKILDEDYYGLVTEMKTKFAPVISTKLMSSEKPLPPKIVELFEKIEAHLTIEV